MAIANMLLFVLGIVGVLGAYAIYSKKVSVKKKDMWTGVLGVLGVGMLVFGYGVAGLPSFTTAPTGDSGVDVLDEGVIKYQQTGSQSTVSVNAYTGIWSGALSKSEVYPLYFIENKDGTLLVDGVNINTTTTFVGEQLTIKGTGATHYLDSINFDVKNDRPTTPDIKAYPISAQTDPQITVKDSSDTALSAQGNNSLNLGHCSDYRSGDLGAGEEDFFAVKFQNKVSDKVMDLNMVCTYTAGDEVDDFTLASTIATSTGLNSVTWKEVSIPKTLKDTDISINNTGITSPAVNATGDYIHCYQASSVMRLNEWDWVELRFNVDTDDSTAPTPGGQTAVGAVFLDAQNYNNKDGNLAYGSFSIEDGTEDPGAVGMDENPEITYVDLDTAFGIELV